MNCAPLKYVDPTGHKEEGACSDPNAECVDDEIYEAYWAYCAENPGDAACEAGDPVELGFWFLVGISGGILVEDLIVIGGGFLGQGVTKAIEAIGSLLCADGDCTNEAGTASQSAQRTIEWMENELNRVQHIMQASHAWDRLVTLSGDPVQDYLAVRPYIQQAIAAGGTQINTSTLGPVMQYITTINGEMVLVKAINLANGVIRITDAWVVTR